jgi:hypothetical protein
MRTSDTAKVRVAIEIKLGFDKAFLPTLSCRALLLTDPTENLLPNSR